MKDSTPSRIALNAFVGFVVGLAGGLVGLGGAELRLPYLAGPLGLPLKKAISVNLAVSLITLLAALPTRLYTLKTASLTPFLYETVALALGAVVGAFAGVSWLRRLSSAALTRAVFVLLLALGLVMISESVVSFAPLGLLPDGRLLRVVSGIALGLVIGAISGLLGVAGGEIIIPTLLLGFGAPIKAAGSLSQMVSIPTVLTGFVRHYRAGSLHDRALVTRLILPMGLGAIAGGIGGGLLASLAPSSLLKALLGVILIVSSIKVFAKQSQPPTNRAGDDIRLPRRRADHG
ncbi:MAG TPA: sulfite exporter TauE/SafE family protein [Bryobacteraceae bacterium]|nr:sulfite exporter TauE/SafE family protein [Bryobacteraceae bacterium]